MLSALGQGSARAILDAQGGLHPLSLMRAFPALSLALPAGSAREPSEVTGALPQGPG
jgi:hypothetical protein